MAGFCLWNVAVSVANANPTLGDLQQPMPPGTLHNFVSAEALALSGGSFHKQFPVNISVYHYTVVRWMIT
jgi:hypothetical protein